MAGVDFGREMFSVLRDAEKEEGSSPLDYLDYQFPLWDLLKEIDRRGRRADRDVGKKVRDYLTTHPNIEEEVKERHGL